MQIKRSKRKNGMNIIEFGDCCETMRRWAMLGFRAQTCVTSPPYYGLRDYKVDGQIGLEATPDEYIKAMVEVFRCVWDVLADDGTLWLNIGDSYAGSGKGRNADGSHKEGGKQGTNKVAIAGALIKTEAPNCKPKDLIGIPWMLAFALRADGWYLRQDIIWHKPNPMPESVRDRCTKAHEYIFLLSKSERYFFDSDAMKEPATGRNPGNKQPHKHAGERFAETKANLANVGPHETRNRRSVWSVATRPYKGAHFATFPPALIEPCILAGSRPSDIVLDPFMGSGTTAAVALQHGRQYLGCELNPEYGQLQQDRIAKTVKEDELDSRQVGLFA
jgi:DNA modification methylase